MTQESEKKRLKAGTRHRAGCPLERRLMQNKSDAPKGKNFEEILDQLDANTYPKLAAKLWRIRQGMHDQGGGYAEHSEGGV